MKKLCLFVFVCAFALQFSVQSFAQQKMEKSEKPAPRALSIQVFPTRQDSVLSDWWYKVPPNKSVSNIATIGWRGDKVCFNIILLGCTKKDNEDFEIKLKIRAGLRGELKNVGERVLKGKMPSPYLLYLTPSFLDVEFEQSDPFGDYCVEVVAQNMKTGEKAKEISVCKLVKWEAPKPLEKGEVLKAFLNFNSNYSPASLYSIFTSPDFSFEQKGAWFGLNPSIYSFCKHAFARNKFLLPILRADFVKASEQVRKNTIILFAISKEKPFEIDLMNPDEVVLQNRIRKIVGEIKDDPYKEIEAPHSLDLLWGEFFALGTYKPIRRIFDTVMFVDERNFANQKLKNKDFNKDDSAEKKKLLKGFCALAADWSIGANMKNPLFRNYFEWAFQNDMSPQMQNEFINLPKRASDNQLVNSKK